MSKLVFKFLLIAAVTAFCVWEIFPIDQQIRLGKDLRGGVSLTYAVNVPEGSGEEVLTQVIEVLKDRVNPQGVLDISMEPQGADRIEVVMPLPNAAVRALQLGFRDTLADLLRCTNIRPAELDAALTEGTLATTHACLAAAETLQALQKEHDDLREARIALQEAVLAQADPTVISGLEDRVVDGEIRLERQRSALLRPLPEPRILRMLALDQTKPVQLDAEGRRIDGPDGQPLRDPSPREEALAALEAEYPGQRDRIAAVVASYDDYASKRTGLDDPEDLKRLLRGAGVLEFRLAVDPEAPEGVNVEDMRKQLAERGPRNTDSVIARWFEVHDLKQWYDDPAQLQALQADPAAYFARRDLVAGEKDGRYYVLLYVIPSKSMTHAADRPWSIRNAGRTRDELGRTAVAFAMDQGGAAQLGALTGPNVGAEMAIVLDEKVYGAPTLQSRISSNGQITGNYGDEEINYLIRVLAAGALEARLSPEPIAVSVLGPSVGRENLAIGLQAVGLSVIVVMLTMLGYYFFAGLVADIALLVGSTIIFGVMAMIDGTFTLPGLAGIALSIGMAVDSNVLIYERIREEMVNNREKLRDAVRIGYSKALSAIIDGNITNLIVCFVLYQTAATEVKGFALTLAIGILATLFSALYVTRAIFELYVDVFKCRSLPMLPTVFPGIHRALEPRIDWLRLRWITIPGSWIVAIAGLVLFLATGRDMLETEFRGGVSMVMTTRAEPDGSALLVKRQEVEERIRAIGEAASDPALQQLAQAKVLTVGESSPELGASSFNIKVANPPAAGADEAFTAAMVAAVVAEFGDEMDVVRPVAFAGSTDAAHADRTFPIEKSMLAEVLRRPSAPVRSVEDFRGGVAVLVEGLEPPLSLDDVAARIDRMRRQPDYSDAVGRRAEVIGLVPADAARPAAGWRDVAIVTTDPEINAFDVELDVWDRDLAASEWRVVQAALTRPASLEQVSSFSASVAENLAAGAVVAVILSLVGMLVYIWARFGSLRYSAAAVAALVFNVFMCLGALAVSLRLAPLGFASQIKLEEFRVDINVVAGLLTIIGYGLNDTIVILDRIRENRGKLSYVSREVVNRSINQTFSRTILTGGTTFVTALILYWLGGTGIRPFAFTFVVGLVFATYSSVMIAAPLTWSRKDQQGHGGGATSDAEGREIVPA
ncbi:MAG: protein translocase subunit SecD [Phycisphaerae bacterium]|nr:protein translocase subunit SecD [Phycisphaerae bacterium]